MQGSMPFGLTLQPGQELVQPRCRLSRGQPRTQSWARLALPAPFPLPWGPGAASGPWEAAGDHWVLPGELGDVLSRRGAALARGGAGQ